MHCKQCNGNMEDTGGASYGTGEKVYRCVDCEWTGVESACTGKPAEEYEKSEDVYYNGIKYSDYKAVLTVKDAAGEQRIEFTTFRADIITAIMREGLVLQAFEPGDTISIEAKPHKLMMSTAKTR